MFSNPKKELRAIYPILLLISLMAQAFLNVFNIRSPQPFRLQQQFFQQRKQNKH